MELSAWLVIAYILTILGVIATVLSENRNPLKASAWIFIVGLIPVFGLMASSSTSSEPRSTSIYRPISSARTRYSTA